MQVVRIENWSVGVIDPYAPPEYRVLRGIVYGHPTKSDGSSVRTSLIRSATGRTVITNTGTYYELGSPDPNYVQWMEDNNIPFDENEPIKMVEEFTKYDIN